MQLDSFLKLEGQKGPSTDGGKVEAGSHFQEFEVLTFHHRIHRAAKAEADRPNNAIHGEVTVYQALGAETPALLESMCKATQYETATLVVRGLDGSPPAYKDLYSLTANKVVITRVHCVANPVFHRFGRATTGGHAALSGSDLGPMVEIELLYFGEISWKYGAGAPQKASPTPTGTGG